MHPQNGIAALFVLNALLIASKGTDDQRCQLPPHVARVMGKERAEALTAGSEPATSRMGSWSRSTWTR